MNMWNLTVFDDNFNSANLYSLYESLQEEISRLNATVEISKNKNAVFIRADEKYLSYIKAIVKQFLAETVVNLYKPQFFENQLNLAKEFDLNGFALLETVCALDKSADVVEVKQNITISNGEFHLHSFWLFGLDTLKKRWQEMCDVIHINMIDIVSTNAFAEVTRYLLKMNDKNCMCVKVLDNENEICFFNDSQQKSLCDPISQQDAHKDTKVVAKLVELAPEIIVWEGEQNASLKQFVLNIFN